MGKKRRILFAVLALAVLGGLAWMVLSPRVEPQPVYQGKPLSAWLEYNDSFNTNRTSELMNAAQTAVRNMGTNAIPTMLRMLRTPDLAWKNRLFALARKQHVFKINYIEPHRLYQMAGTGLEVLGPRAAGAVPELMKIYDQNPAAQMYIARVIGSIGPDAKAAVPSLLLSAASTNYFVRLYSLIALGEIHDQPHVVIPVLIQALQDLDRPTRYYAVRGLEFFGTNSVPALVKFIESKEPPPLTNASGFVINRPSVKTEALGALRQIDPEAAAKVSTNMDR